GDPPPSGLVAAGAGIRGWTNGGPSGAAWNVAELRCTARATSSCAKGKLLFTLRAGQQLLQESASPLVNGMADLSVVTPEAIWRRGFDKPGKAKSTFKLPFG